MGMISKPEVAKERSSPMTIQEGKAAPAFTLPDQSGNKVSLKEFKGKNIILYFYPKETLPGEPKRPWDSVT